MEQTPEKKVNKISKEKLSMADKIAKFEIELFTTNKFEEMTRFERTVVQSLINALVLLIIIAGKI